MSVTRLSIYGGIGIPYGAFSGKTEAPAAAPSATVAGGSHRKRRQRRFRVEYQGQVFYVLGEDRAEALLRAIQEISEQEAVVPQVRKIRIKPIRRTKVEIVEDEIGKRLRKIEEDDEEELLAAILTSVRFH